MTKRGEELEARFFAYVDESGRRTRRSDVLRGVWALGVVAGILLHDVRVLMAMVGLSLTMVVYWGAHLLYLLWWRRALRRAGLWEGNR